MFTNIFTIIYQHSWLTRTVSTDWKLAKVTSSYKVDQKEDTEIYRPVSMVFMLGKVMDQNILRGITQQVQGNQEMRPSQHGFRKVASCRTCLILIVCNQVTCLVDKGKATDVVFLGISKAFDTVSHRIILKKLTTYGLDGWSVHYIKDGWLGLESGGQWSQILSADGH